MANLGKEATNESVLSLDDIEDVLECVICLEFPITVPIYQCNNGHVLCSSCHGRVTDCPTCRGRLGKVRCLAMEKVLEKFPKPCRFKSSGCSIRLDQTRLDKHEGSCAYKPVSCPMTNCAQLLSIEELIKHFDENHNCKEAHSSEDSSIICDIGTTISTLNTTTIALFRWNLIHPGFIGMCWRESGIVGNWHIGVYLLNTFSCSKDRTFTVRIGNSEMGEELSYTGQCLSLDMKFDETSKQGRCLTFTDAIAKRISCDNKLYVHHVLGGDPAAQANQTNYFPFVIFAYFCLLCIYNFWW